MSNDPKIAQIPLELWDVISSAYGAAFYSSNFRFAHTSSAGFCGLLVYMPFHFPSKKAEQINFLPLTSLSQSSQPSNLAGCLETGTSFANSTTCQICLC